MAVLPAGFVGTCPLSGRRGVTPACSDNQSLAGHVHGPCGDFPVAGWDQLAWGRPTAPRGVVPAGTVGSVVAAGRACLPNPLASNSPRVSITAKVSHWARTACSRRPRNESGWMSILASPGRFRWHRPFERAMWCHTCVSETTRVCRACPWPLQQHPCCGVKVRSMFACRQEGNCEIRSFFSPASHGFSRRAPLPRGGQDGPLRGGLELPT